MLKPGETTLQPMLNLNLRVFVYPGLMFLLFYPPFLRGLFFAPELLITHMFTGILFALCWYDKILQRDVAFLKGPLDYAGLALVIVYVLSLFGAVNMRGAVGELLKVINYFMVYWITKETVTSENNIKAVYRAIYSGAVGVAMVGLAAAMKLIEYPGAILDGRIYSTLQYPNTTAAFLSLATFLGLALLNTSRTRVGKIVYAAGNTLMMAVIVASQSRGSWALYPLVVTVFFLGLPKEYRFKTLYNLVIQLGIGLQLARVLQPRILAGTALSAWKYMVLAAVGAVAAQWAYDLVIAWMDRREVRESTRRMCGAGVVVYAVIVALVYITYTSQAIPSVAGHFVPAAAINRAGTIHNQDTSFLARMDLTKASLKMALDYPVNGLGGEGWNALYHRYMPYLMYSSETHNYPAKVLVETGFIGLLALAAVWICWGRDLYRLWRARLEEDSWLLVWSGGAAALMLGVHSIYDFDLSMGAMGIVLWALLGVTTGAGKRYLRRKESTNNSSRRLLILALGGTLAAALLFVPAARLYAAGEAAAEGARAMTKKNWAEAELKLLKATKLDPLTASYAADLSQVYTIRGMAGNDKSLMTKGEEYVRRAVRTEPYNYNVRLRLLMVSLLSGRVEQAVADAESLVAHNPLDIHNFEILGKMYVTSGRYLYETGQKDEAAGYWKKALTLSEQLNQKAAATTTRRGWNGDPLRVTPVVNLFEGEAAYFLGDYQKAARLLGETTATKQALPGPLLIEAKLYLSAVKAKEGRLDEAEKEVSAMAKEFPAISGEFKKIISFNP